MIYKNFIENRNHSFVLLENGLNIFYSTDLNIVIHEMLSIIMNHLMFLKLNNINTIIHNIDLYIQVQLKTKGKRYPIKYCNINFSFDKYDFIVSNQYINITLDEPNIDLIKQIRNLSPPNNKNILAVKKLRSFDETNIESNLLDTKNKYNEHNNANSLLHDSLKLININTNHLNNDITKQNDKSKELPEELSEELPEEISEEISEEILKEQIEKLEAVKNQQEETLITLLDKNNDEKENIVEIECKINEQKMIERIQKDMEQQKKNIYYSDKDTYFKMKNDISLGKLNENLISPLFKQKYPIFKFMDSNSDINSDNSSATEYELYCHLFNELYPAKFSDEEQVNYIPHNYHYLEESEKNKYKNFVSTNKEKIPSYDDLLMELNESDRDDLINNNGLPVKFFDTDDDTDDNTDDDTDDNTDFCENDSIAKITQIFKKSI